MNSHPHAYHYITMPTNWTASVYTKTGKLITQRAIQNKTEVAAEDDVMKWLAIYHPSADFTLMPAPTSP